MAQPEVPYDVAALLRRATDVLAGSERVLLGIAGPPGSGKTTLAEALLAAVRESPPAGLSADVVAHVPMDGFHLADVQLERLGLRERKGAPETFDDEGYAALLERLRSNQDDVVYAPSFERTLEQPVAASIAVPQSVRLVLTEGNYLLLPDRSWPRARACLAEIWYCDLPSASRVRRLVERHHRFGKSRDAARRWVRDIDEPNAVLVDGTRSRADVIVVVPDALAAGHLP